MKEEKVASSKIFNFFDWVWRLMVLNVLTIITSLGIITIVPSICACFKTIKDTKETNNPGIFKPYFYNFRYLFRDTVWFSVILVLLIFVCGYAYLWYDGVIGETSGSLEHLDQVWLVIAMFSIVIVFCSIIVVTMAFIQIPMIITYFSYGYRDNIRLSFLIAFRYLITTLIEFVIVLASIVLLFNAIVTNSLIPIWLFFGISLPSYLVYIVSRRVYTIISNNEDDDIDYQNKTINRENYEDEQKTYKGENDD